ncbi:TIGR00730 family Rossman fold protein [uncultured Roseobacter sp.]|uniref:LOG family protein n=1 Tax=uncultured Roseobacter sp. TaxID=114847 RepID=UPI00262C19B6|nr:TIGR00730 family Rossman fold protein [uncultured Roseobacter sp.]
MMVGGPLFQNKSIAVFCGSASGNHYDYQSDAFDTGRALASAGHRIVYGGGHVGLMGALADGCIDARGHITGVMPRALVDREIAHKGLSELRIVADMHERKADMADRADAFVVLPGGSGTLEEFFEQWTWGQIGYHEKPIGLLNLSGYFDPLLTMLDQMVHCGFLSKPHREMLLDGSNVSALLEGFACYNHPPVKGYNSNR